MRIRALRDWTVKSICGHIRFMRTKRQGVAQKPLTPRGAATRARIVEAAAQLVGDRGVAGTSLDDIMAASQTSKSQLYHYFADKDALVCAVVEAQAGRVIGFQESCLKNVRSLADLRKWRDAVVKSNRARRGVGGCPIGSLASEPQTARKPPGVAGRQLSDLGVAFGRGFPGDYRERRTSGLHGSEQSGHRGDGSVAGRSSARSNYTIDGASRIVA